MYVQEWSSRQKKKKKSQKQQNSRIHIYRKNISEKCVCVCVWFIHRIASPYTAITNMFESVNLFSNLRNIQVQLFDHNVYMCCVCVYTIHVCA